MNIFFLFSPNFSSSSLYNITLVTFFFSPFYIFILYFDHLSSFLLLLSHLFHCHTHLPFPLLLLYLLCLFSLFMNTLPPFSVLHSFHHLHHSTYLESLPYLLTFTLGEAVCIMTGATRGVLRGVEVVVVEAGGV